MVEQTARPLPDLGFWAPSPHENLSLGWWGSGFKRTWGHLEDLLRFDLHVGWWNQYFFSMEHVLCVDISTFCWIDFCFLPLMMVPILVQSAKSRWHPYIFLDFPNFGTPNHELNHHQIPQIAIVMPKKSPTICGEHCRLTSQNIHPPSNFSYEMGRTWATVQIASRDFFVQTGGGVPPILYLESFCSWFLSNHHFHFVVVYVELVESSKIKFH